LDVDRSAFSQPFFPISSSKLYLRVPLRITGDAHLHVLASSLGLHPHRHTWTAASSCVSSALERRVKNAAALLSSVAPHKLLLLFWITIVTQKKETSIESDHLDNLFPTNVCPVPSRMTLALATRMTAVNTLSDTWPLTSLEIFLVDKGWSKRYGGVISFAMHAHYIGPQQNELT
jgi:hypothetical protein